MRQPGEYEMRAKRLAKLEKDYEARHAYWLGSNLDPGLRNSVTQGSHVPAEKFWTEVNHGFLPAVKSRDSAAMDASYRRMGAYYNEHRTFVDSTVALVADYQAALKIDSDRQLSWAIGILAALAAAILTLVAAACFLLLRNVVQPLTEIVSATTILAGGGEALVPCQTRKDELGEMAGAINHMAASLSSMIAGMRSEARRATFGHQLTEALDMADREQQVAAIAARAMAEVSAVHPMELLIADSSRAQMERAAEHQSAGAPGCGVSSPYDCVAVRRGTVVRFGHSDELNACVHLLGRPCGATSAVCVPVTFMGRAIGALHATGPVDQPLSAEQAEQLGTLGTQLGMRIGTVRAFEKTQIQAATDALTGLPNRRTVEQRLRSVASGGKPYTIVMCDLDRFKLLNDTYGHATGDAALRVFAEVLRASVRDGDIAGRWGGEEFTIIFDNCHAAAAHETIDQFRKRLAGRLKLGKTPVFTASFGIADSSMSHQSGELIKLADLALYEAKANGRDRACIADASPQEIQPAVRRADMSGAGLEVAAVAANGSWPHPGDTPFDILATCDTDGKYAV
jgi:diguanylate cyclase (GGDEF)-like protein